MSRQGICALLAFVLGLAIAVLPVGLFPRWAVVAGLVTSIALLVLAYWPQASNGR